MATEGQEEPRVYKQCLSNDSRDLQLLRGQEKGSIFHSVSDLLYNRMARQVNE